jgi:DNA repair exonuclease SbcCD nuclease subunit
MNILAFGDLHIGKKSSNSYFLDIDKKVIDLVCEEVRKSKIERVIFLGDLIHNRSESTPKSLVVARYALDKLNALNIPIIMILGNHDTYYNNMKDANYYRIFNGLYRNITFVEGIAWDENLLYVGWMQNPEEEKKYKETSKDYKWIFGHFEFKGAEMSEYYKTTEGLENTNSDSYIFSGHIHQRSQQGKLHYIGCPYPQTKNGTNRQDYGYVLINTNTEEIRYVDLHLYYYNEYKLQNLLMRIAMDKEEIKKEMEHSDTRVIVDVPLDEKQLADIKIFLNTFKARSLLVEKEEETLPMDNIVYDKLALSSPIDFIQEYIGGMKIEEVQRGRILDKVRTILNQ